jgi:hypothetical protein
MISENSYEVLVNDIMEEKCLQECEKNIQSSNRR